MAEREIKSFELTLRGETRQVEARDCWGDGKRFDSIAAVGAYQRRPGARIWADRIFFWQQKDGTYRAATSTTILNRSGCPLVGWADKLVQCNPSQHNSAI